MEFQGREKPQDCQFPCTLVFQELGQGFPPQKSKHSILGFFHPNCWGWGSDCKEQQQQLKGEMCLTLGFFPLIFFCSCCNYLPANNKPEENDSLVESQRLAPQSLFPGVAAQDRAMSQTQHCGLTLLTVRVINRPTSVGSSM